ncbi:aspartyl/asparaginyl beta-hydroxylase domain-containing protein [Novosphingobium sp. 1949]|uniref:Aspartyl/asparaginyl beta-hydroxylase domain-containing protein n=1 Tax=Novosphingobium organovorum TaxID=2930092 RepID=A0ABT0BIK4_9SPHN|nr:aspartyl/asparaginyl beta-hydroxylase domain-containing protein [Novosphingobium organovorum]MCJ2184882.1 aspartyl/asparaginyl beta-hydroxylase domain-containing protein [Novosphingobium organovorum]
MSWNETLKARGRKVPFVGKSLFQIGKELRPGIDRMILRDSRLPDVAIQNTGYFPWIARLEANWEAIRDEALRIRAQDIPSLGDISFDHGRIAADRRWRAFFLKGYGYRMKANAARAPITARLLETVPGLVTANFSVLEAGGHIPRHWGMTKGMLTWHLALKSPRERTKCRMHVEEGETTHVLHWDEGRSFLFDDMFNHEVWNETDEDRTILLIQIKRPCRWRANLVQDLFLKGVRHSRFVQDIRKAIDREGGRVAG